MVQRNRYVEPYDIIRDPYWTKPIEYWRPKTDEEVLSVLLKNAGYANPTSYIDQVVECINRHVYERVREVINPHLVMTDLVMMLDWSIEARTRKLRTRMNCAEFRKRGYVPEMIERAIDGISSEILEFDRQSPYALCPYALVTGHDQLVDPSNFEEFIYFRTRYGLYELP